MKSIVLAILLVCVAGKIDQLHAAMSTVNIDPVTARSEFDQTFGSIKIYVAIKDHLPEEYEKLFQSYLRAQQTGNREPFRVADFVNSVRSTHLKQASSDSILSFYQHLTANGRDLLAKDPDAAFSYLFGVQVKDYSPYIDYQAELDAMGGIFEKILATSRPENLLDIDAHDADLALNLIYIDLLYRYKDKFSLLQRNDYSGLTAEERQTLCDMYLHMHEEIFRLEPPTRDHVLRSFAMLM